MNLAEIPVCIIYARQRTGERTGRTQKETRQARERELPAKRGLGIDVALHAFDVSPELDAVRSMVPINFVGISILVLNDRRRHEIAKTKSGETRDRDPSILPSGIEGKARGVGCRIHRLFRT